MAIAGTDRNDVRTTLMAGSLSGIVSTSIMYPFDVIRTKMQFQYETLGPVQVLRRTLQQGGIRALYAGITLPLSAQAVYKGTVFSVNDVTQNAILNLRSRIACRPVPATELTMSDRFWSGVVGGGVNAALFVTPVEFVRNQVIAQRAKQAVSSADTFQVIRDTIRLQGVVSLWRGTFWSVVRDSIGCGCFFCTMSFAQQQLKPPDAVKAPFHVVVTSGALAGLSFWLVALPLDTIKTWVQSADISQRSMSATQEIGSIFSKGGFAGVTQRLFRGWQVAYGRGMPSSAITITVYSYLYRMFEST